MTRASEELNISQPSTSNALARRRNASGDVLLERVGNEMIPTQYAHTFWPYVREALNAIESGLASVSDFDPGDFDSCFRIGMDAYCISFIAPNLIARIKRDAPKARVEILPAPPHTMEEDMLRDRCDLIIGPVWRKNSAVREQVLFVEELVLLVAPHHRFVDEEGSLTPEAYAKASHVLYSSDGIQREQIDTRLANMGLARDVKAAVSFYPSIGGILKTTDYVCSLGRALAEQLARAHDLCIFDLPFEPPTFDVSMIWAPRNEHSNAHRWLRTVCAETARSSETRSTSAAVPDHNVTA